MKKIYKFVGGNFGGCICEEKVAKMVHGDCGRGTTDSYSRRVELQNELQFKGYLGPMWDGYAYKVDGCWHSRWDCSEEEMKTAEKAYVLRYETQEVYDMMSE